MTDHEKVNAIIKSMGGRKVFAQKIGLTQGSVRNQLAPAKKLPRWAKSMLLINEKNGSDIPFIVEIRRLLLENDATNKYVIIDMIDDWLNELIGIYN